MPNDEFAALANKAAKEKELSYILPALRHLAVPLDSLTIDPKNVRMHDARSLEAIQASLDEFGQRLPIIVQKQGSVVCVGNGRVEAARRLGWLCIAALVVDESDAAAAKYAIVDNRTAELAAWDYEGLAKTLEQFGDLSSADGMADMMPLWNLSDLANIQGLEPPNPTKEYAAASMPKYTSPGRQPHRTVFVHFENAADVEDFARLLGQSFTDKAKFIWHPKAPRVPYPSTLENPSDES